jgi:hypothetical protein
MRDGLQSRAQARRLRVFGSGRREWSTLELRHVLENSWKTLGELLANSRAIVESDALNARNRINIRKILGLRSGDRAA